MAIEESNGPRVGRGLRNVPSSPKAYEPLGARTLDPGKARAGGDELLVGHGLDVPISQLQFTGMT